MSLSKRGFFEKTVNKARRTKESDSRVIVVEDDDNVDDDDDATVPLESEKSVVVADVENDLTRVPWQHVIVYLRLSEIALLGATCRFLFARVRADVRDIDLRAVLSWPRAANIAKFANQCTGLHSFTCRLSQVASLPIAVRPHKLVVAVDQVPLPPRGIAWTEIKELTLIDGLSPVFAPALLSVLQLCAPNLRRLQVDIGSFALTKMHAMPKLVHLALPLYGRAHVKWATLWQRLPELRSLILSHHHVPMEKLPNQLQSLSVSYPACACDNDTDLGALLQTCITQCRLLGEQCAHFSSLELGISVSNQDQVLTIASRLLGAIALPRLEHLRLNIRSDTIEPHVTDAGQAQIREALARCRARSSSLWHVELAAAQRFRQAVVYDFSSR